MNPFYRTKFETPHGTFPFNKLKAEDYEPAFKKAIKLHNEDIEKIAENVDSATFENTIVALECSGAMLDEVEHIFFALNSADTSDELQQIAQDISPLLTKHANDINLNKKLFSRIKTVYDERHALNLNTEDNRLLEETYEGFISSGANLPNNKKEEFRKLSETLSLASLQFEQNMIKSINDYKLVITDKNELSGLPEDFLEQSAFENDKGETNWKLTLQITSYLPVMKFANNRPMREKIWMAYNTQCLAGTKFDNTELIKTIVNTRLKIAQMLGYKTYADYALHDKMAKNPAIVHKLLDDLFTAYKPVADKEIADLQKFAKQNGADFDLQPWDFAYYSEKLKKSLFDLNDEMLKPYFELSNVIKGVFGLATELYGLKFTYDKNIPIYHPDTKGWKVTDASGKFIAVLYTDFHPRDSKQSGAWMTEFKGQWHDADGNDSRPHISIVMNFTKPTATKPALLTFDEVTTFLHEFGHALHGMLTECTYESLSGTNVYRDFVEMPSQIMENFATEKAFLDQWAEHYKTGEKIPAELIQKIVDSTNFQCGYACLRQLGFGLQDMAFHEITEPFTGDVLDIEKKSTKKVQLLPEVPNTGRCTTFHHIFGGGYAAGYYGYKWAEVLDADAFEAFKEHGIFDKQTATAFKENILQKGNTEPPMVLYKRFRGKEPNINALLKRNGIK